MSGFRPTLKARSTMRLAGLLLLLLALRALVPTGFMATVAETGIQMVFCEPGATGSAHHGHAHHHGHGGSADPSCPFAQSAGPAPLPAIPMLAAEAPVQAFIDLLLHAQTTTSPGPPRQQTPRGPPDLA
ncbi:MAG: hypothetical protein NTZ79_00725 [Proteobacteria bacterium]|nr:hypothetical protein [Pseudomonadota bacterium]